MSNEIIQRLCKMSLSQQNYLCRSYAKFDTQTRVNIEDSKRSIFHQLKGVNKDLNNSVLSLAAWFLAVKSFMQETDMIKLRVMKEGNKRSRVQNKRQKLLSYWAIVKTLKEDEQMSFRQISQYLLKYHRFEVSYSTIYELWTELEVQKNIKEK